MQIGLLGLIWLGCVVGFGVVISVIAIYWPEQRKEALGVLALMALGLVLGAFKSLALFGFVVLVASVLCGCVVVGTIRPVERKKM